MIFKKIYLLFLFLFCGLYAKPDTLNPVIVGKIPHDPYSFTQGFVIAEDGYLYESSGAPYGRVSGLSKIDKKNGKIIKHIPVYSVFAEGLTNVDNMLIQLTWRDNTAFFYELSTLNKIRKISYNGEGWGLTFDDRYLVMSNGSDTLYYVDMDFHVIKKTAVKLNNRPLVRLNELEYVNGMIYANVWHLPYIYVIDKSGTVRTVINCKKLVQISGAAGSEAVLNGIAYDREENLFYLTGKDWYWIFKVKLKLNK